MTRKWKMSGGASALAIAVGLALAAGAPAHAQSSAESRVTTDIATAPLTPEQQAVADQVTALTSAVDQHTRTFDSRKVDATLLDSEAGASFLAAYAAEGGTIIAADGEAAAPAASTLRESMSAAAASGGRIWQDAWGVHMTVPKDTMDRLATLAATGSGAAGAVAALLAANIEGFPISTTGALASGAVAVALIGVAGALQLCNINGNGAQVNYNWVVWTCWPL